MKIFYQRILFNNWIINLKNKICYLYFEPWSDINIIKRYQQTKNYIQRKIIRVMIDKNKIKGEILSLIFLLQTSIINFIENLETVFKTLTFHQMILSNFQNLMNKKIGKRSLQQITICKQHKLNPNPKQRIFWSSERLKQ